MFPYYDCWKHFSLYSAINVKNKYQRKSENMKCIYFIYVLIFYALNKLQEWINQVQADCWTFDFKNATGKSYDIDTVSNNHHNVVKDLIFEKSFYRI